jgi:redox-sensitive bicupin YhaK (pirin superfamily)
VHGLQSWVALPQEDEEIAPSFAHFGHASLPAFEEPGVRGRLIAGQAFGLQAAPTRSPLFYVHWILKPQAKVPLPLDYRERAAYVVSGKVEVAGQVFGPGQMLIFSPGSAPVLTAKESAVVMGLGGEPVGERFIEWNFVSSSRERIEQAKADWRAGRMKLPDLDNGEFIPLP